MSSVLQLLLIFGAHLAGAADTFTVYSDPIQLRYGEVHNRLDRVLPLPADIVARYAVPGAPAMAVLNFTMDIVRKGADGAETRVPLYDHYLHHYILDMGSSAGLGALAQAARDDRESGLGRMQQAPALRRLRKRLGGSGHTISFGGASGAEYRDNPHVFKHPFRMILPKPQSWAPTLHIINTNRANIDGGAAYDGTPSPLLQCPCTPQRRFDFAAGTIDGEKPYPPFGHCSPQFLNGRYANPSCNISTYQGGWRCCAHGVFLIDTSACKRPGCAEYPEDEVFVRFTFAYEDAAPAHRPLASTACCDVTSDFAIQGNGNIEYDVPACAAGTPPAECTHTVVSVQPVEYFYSAALDGNLTQVDLAFAAPHVHVSALSLELQDAVTGKTLCKVTRDGGASPGGVAYGTGLAAGNEANYLVGLRPCSWGGAEAPRFMRSHPLRTIAVYNASNAQTGVMSLWLMSAAQVYDAPACKAALAAAGCLARPDADACVACAQNASGAALETTAALMRSGCGDVWIQDDLLPQFCSAAPQRK
eukprot:g6662.t1